MSLKLTKILIQAQKYLVYHPYDLAHDITHHYRVWKYCHQIIESEKLCLNKDAVSIAAWWHDIEDRGGEAVTNLQNLLKQQQVKLDFIKKVVRIIKEHSFGRKQTSLEAKVLFDADKLEYVNLQRLSWFIQITKDGLIKRKVALKYYRQWYKRTPQLPSLFHFQFSRKEFKKNYQKAADFLNEKAQIFST